MVARKTYFLVAASLLAAIGLVLELYVHFPVLPQAPYLLYSPGDLPVIVAALLLGPAAGAACAFVKASLFVVLTGQGGPWGALMHFVASGGMVIAIALLNRRFGRLPLSLLGGVIARVALMVPMNLLVTPLYTGLPVSVVAGMIVPVVIPFNILHAGINLLLAFPLVRALPDRVVARFKTRAV